VSCRGHQTGAVVSTDADLGSIPSRVVVVGASASGLATTNHLFPQGGQPDP
jgi:hypothetical protein